MEFDKAQLLDLLRQQGDHDKAAAAERELPERVDTDQHSGALGRIGLDPQDLISKITGGGGIGGLLGR